GEGASPASGRALPSPGVGETQGPADHHSVRGTRRRGEGRHDSRHHRTCESPRVPPRGVTRSIRPREEPDVYTALYAALPGGWRDRDLRPQLVQPCRCRIRDGILYQGTAPALPRTLPGGRSIHRGWRDHPDKVLARGEQRGTGAAIRGSDRGSVAPVEAQSNRPAVT